MKSVKRVACFIMAIAMMMTVVPGTAEAATKWKVSYPGAVQKARLNKKKVTLTITKKKKNPTTTLKMKGLSKKQAKKAKWSTSNKSVATVKKGKVTAKKAGKATIACKVKGKKYSCKVTVVNKKVSSNKKASNSNNLKVTVKEKASDTGLGPEMPLHVNEQIKEELKNLGYYEYDGTFVPHKMDIPDPIPGGGEAYAVNKIMVTYNGRDVTNEAKYEIDKPQIASMTAPGTIKLSTKGVDFELTVSYKGEKKTFKMRKAVVKGDYVICYCGACFGAKSSCSTKNTMHDENGNICGEGGYSCPMDSHKIKYHCIGHYVTYFTKYIDVKVNQ